MASPQLISTERIGQITGSTDLSSLNPKWPLTVDAEQWPLLNETGHWGALGADLGANAEHNDGRLYIFFGDTARTDDSPNLQNTDMMAWVDETKILRHGGHLAMGLHFVLPFQPTSVHGQPDWRFCVQCGGLFWNDPSFRSTCPKSGNHIAAGLNFVLPFEPTNVNGQPEWRFCINCGGLFWDGEANKGVCPTGSTHVAAGFRFILPFNPAPVSGQPEWRFCINCRGLFWNDDGFKGFCPGAKGGGFHIHPVLNTNTRKFEPFTAGPPIGQTLSLELPNAAFSYDNKMYVFAGIGDPKFTKERPRPGDPAVGSYLVSKERPDLPGPYHKEFLFSPRIGYCPKDASRDILESHEPLGFKFVLTHDIPEEPGHESNWHFCGKCATMFWNDANTVSVCSRGGSHVAAGSKFNLPSVGQEDSQNQGNWSRCIKCASVFWNGDPAHQTGLCPAGDNHKASNDNLILPFVSIPEDGNHQADWRFCVKCAGMFWNGSDFKGICSKDGLGHEHRGFNFVLPHDIPEDGQHQPNWSFCRKCAGMFWNGNEHFKGTCPKDSGSHEAAGFNFVLPHHVNDNAQNQKNWRFCNKCAGLFWNGDPRSSGSCPKDGRGHETNSLNFVLQHNPGEDINNQVGWRFCTKCFGLVWTGQEGIFTWPAPVQVQNADHPGLPATSHSLGLVMFGFGYSGNPGIRLAWMPLKFPQAPVLQDILYYTGIEAEPWSSEESRATVILPHANKYTHLSATWLQGPRRWILLYSTADDDLNPESNLRLPTMARIGTTLWKWSKEIPIFDPVREQAYGRYIHEKGGNDNIHPNLPPMQDLSVKPEHDGWSYGAFLLNRFTNWNETKRELDIYYLLSFGSPYQVQVMASRLLVPDESFHISTIRHLSLFHGGNGVTLVDSGLPMQGIFYGITSEGNLEWNRYIGHGEQEEDVGNVQGWFTNSGNLIGRGFDGMLRVFACGQGVIMAIHPNGNLHWYCYSGNGESDVTGTLGWDANSGNVIGNGWQNFQRIFVAPRAGAASSRLQIFAVAQNGDLHWYSYSGNGEHDPSGFLGWDPNSGNRIGNGWQNFRHIHGSANVFFAILENGDLLWYSYNGEGVDDVSANTGWHPNSGNPIGNGWQNMQHVFGGVIDSRGFGHVIMAVDQNGDLRWYNYMGEGESDISGNLGWQPGSGNRIGTGW